MNEDIAFDFDAQSILGPMKQVMKGWQQMINVMEKTPKKTEPAMQKTNKSVGGMKMGLGKVLGLVGLIAAGFAAIKNVLSNIPEVGRAFSIAGDIFMRNLLSPLRQELMPLLNKMLAWVRDNRTMFVSWGEHIATAFRIVLEVAKMLWNSLKIIFKSISDTIASFFGGATQSLADTLRVILTKIAATIIFVMILLEPVFKLIGKIIGTLIVAVSNFVQGFIEGFAEVADAINLSGAFQDLIDVLSEFWDEISPVVDILFFLGKVIGKIVAANIYIMIKIVTLFWKILTVIVKTVVEFIKQLVLMVTKGRDVQSIFNAVSDAFISVVRWIGDVIDKILEFASEVKGKVAGAIKSFVNTLNTWGKKIIGFFSEVIDKVKEAINWIRSFFGASDEFDKKADAAEKRAQRLGVPGVSGGAGASGVNISDHSNRTTNIYPTTPEASRAAVQEAQNSSSLSKQRAAKMEAIGAY